jgi:preprotein translocase subunit SecA
MFGRLLKKVIGTKNERELKRLSRVVEKINAQEKSVSRLSDQALADKTSEFKKRLSAGETLDGLLVEAFAVVREVAKRVLGERPFDVQLMGGIVLHEGKIAEMKTGEGKTLAATLPVYLNSLLGKGVHVVTVNDYLAKRDSEWMGGIYKFLGLRVGTLQNDSTTAERQEAYQADVTYGTNNEFGFDYLRDNMVTSLEEKVQRGHHYAIVDEVDSILIDEARTPLIISGPAEEFTEKYYQIDRIVPALKRDVDYTVEEKNKTIALTEEGVKKAEKLLGVDNLYHTANIELIHHITQALRAHILFHRDRDYIVKDGEVVIVDEFTGRLMPGRRWSDGLHQAIQAKERVKIESENQTLATITLQNYFRMYQKLAGMTGTADTEAAEFAKIYNLDVVVIPTNEPMIRVDHPDCVYKTEREKFKAAVKEIVELYRRGQPVLVGTVSIEKSERLSRMLREEGIPHAVLNAKYHEKEAQIIAKAGLRGAVTIATNMAGRGVDIKLGEGVKELGGLHVLGTERHESRRIDNQLRGRAGRQGDPGSSRFYVSLEDDLMRIFGGERMKGWLERLGVKEGEVISHPLISKSIENAQKRVETHNFDIRKHLLEYDDVMNQQRNAIYTQRDEILKGEDLKEKILGMIEEKLTEVFSIYTNGKREIEQAELKSLLERLSQLFPIKFSLPRSVDSKVPAEELKESFLAQIHKLYTEKEQAFGESTLRLWERLIMLQVLDHKWKEHLYAMDRLREGIHLRAYGQRDPLIEYKSEAFEMFQEMLSAIQEDIIRYIFMLREVSETTPRQAPRQVKLQETRSFPTRERKVEQPVKRQQKIGRNQPCPCGSGKKYKKCCGK